MSFAIRIASILLAQIYGKVAFRRINFWSRFLFVKPFHNWYQIIKWRAWLQFWFSLNCGDHFRLSPFLPFTHTYILINGIKLHVAPGIAVLNMYAKSTFLSITFLKEAWRRSNNSLCIFKITTLIGDILKMIGDSSKGYTPYKCFRPINSSYMVTLEGFLSKNKNKNKTHVYANTCW